MAITLASITVKYCIEAAMRRIGALSEGEQMSADMAQDAMIMLAALIAQWSQEGLVIPYLSRTVLLGDNTKASYTWGPGGDIDGVAPVSVAAVSFQLETNQYPLDQADETLFMGNRILGVVAQPRWFYFERAATAKLHFDVAPYGGQFRISSYAGMVTALNLTDALEFPPEYVRFIRDNLALDLCPDYDREPSAVLVASADAAKRTILARNNTPVPSQRLDLPTGYFTDLDYGLNRP